MEGSSTSKTVIRLASPKILWESVDSNTLVINLANGSYYNLEQSASVLWKLLLAGHPLEGIIEKFRGKFSLPHETIMADFSQWIELLEQEELIAVSREGTAASDTESMPAGDNLGLGAYSKPGLNKFTDLEALLLADPIHEFGSSEEK